MYVECLSLSKQWIQKKETQGQVEVFLLSVLLLSLSHVYHTYSPPVVVNFLQLNTASPHRCHNLEGDVYSVGVSDDEKNGGRQGGRAHFHPRAP